MKASRSICAMRVSWRRSHAATASAIEAAAIAAAAAASAADGSSDVQPHFEALEGATLAHKLPVRRCVQRTAPEIWIQIFGEGLQRMQ